MVFLSTMSVSSTLTEAEEGSRERPVYRQLARSTGNNLELQLASTVGACVQPCGAESFVCGRFANPNRQCQGYCTVGHPVGFYRKLENFLVLEKPSHIWVSNVKY